jgi:hypothetical protein
MLSVRDMLIIYFLCCFDAAYGRIHFTGTYSSHLPTLQKCSSAFKLILLKVQHGVQELFDLCTVHSTWLKDKCYHCHKFLFQCYQVLSVHLKVHVSCIIFIKMGFDGNYWISTTFDKENQLKFYNNMIISKNKMRD